MPGWTDFNEADPGITFVEVFAWLAFALLFALAFRAYRRRRRRSGDLP